MFEATTGVQIKSNVDFDVVLKYGNESYLIKAGQTVEVPEGVASTYFLYKTNPPANEKIRESIIEMAYRRILNYNTGIVGPDGSTRNLTLEQAKLFVNTAEIIPVITSYRVGEEEVNIDELEEAIQEVKKNRKTKNNEQ